MATASAGARTWQYSYYTDGSLQAITAPEGVYTHTYNAVGQTVHVAYANGSTADYAYDLQHRLTQVANWGPGGTPPLLSQHDYQYGSLRNRRAGLIASVSESIRGADQTLYGPHVTSYSYDDLYQLTEARYPEYDAALEAPWSNQRHAWAYDPIGNRTGFDRYDLSSGILLDSAAYTYNLDGIGPQLTGITHTTAMRP